MLIVHLFVNYALINLCHFFPSSWCRGLAAASAYGFSWTFLKTFSGQIGSKLLFPWQQKGLIALKGENDVSTFSRLKQV